MGAIRKAVEEKDRRIQELELSLSNQGRQRDGKEMLATMEERLAEVMRKNAQLESEVKEAQQRAARNMTTSFAPVPETDTNELYRQLQEENSQLRAQLTRSMTSLISTGKVSVSSCSLGRSSWCSGLTSTPTTRSTTGAVFFTSCTPSPPSPWV